MIGWIVEKTRRSGWRTKWRRLRTLTTRASVISARSFCGERRRHRDGAAGRSAAAARARGTLSLAGSGRPSPFATSPPDPFSLGGAPVN
jgi:hypothetical protein